MKKEKQFSPFEKFTNLYSLSKTLRFELRPTEETKTMLEEAQVFAKDEVIQKKYEATKPYFNRLHREFVDEALLNVKINGLSYYFQTLQEWQKDKKNKDSKKIYEKKTQELRKQIVKFFDDKANEWASYYDKRQIEYADKKAIKIKFVDDSGKKISGTKIFSSKGVLGILLDKFPEAKNDLYVFCDGFFGYYDKFKKTRENFYKDDGTSTALATRMIDQNLKRFCDNLALFENIKEKVDFSEVEQNFGVVLTQVFSLEYYNQCLLQNGIDGYNDILGGKPLKNGKKKKGLNECINLYKQKTGEKLSFFKTLDKQILSEKERFLDEIKSDEKLLEVLKNFEKTAEEKIPLLKNLFADFVENNENYDLSQIYIEKKQFDPNSCKWIDKSSIDNFQQSLYEVMKKEKLAKYDKKEESYKFPDFIALSYIKTALENGKSEGNFWKEKYYEISGFSEKTFWEQFLAIFSFEFSSLLGREITNQETGEKKMTGYNPFKRTFEALLQNFKVDQNAKIVIKDFADSVLTVYQMAKYFAVEKKRAWLAEYDLDSFYTHPEMGHLKFYDNAYEDIVQVYNDLRNYLTKKPYSEEKWKLNFENPTLANGWDKNKESDNSAIILRKNGEYYWGLMVKGYNKIFDDRYQEKFTDGLNEGKYEKIVYKFFPDQAKMFPKVCFSAKGLEFFKPSEEIWNIYQNDEFKNGDTFSVQSMQKFIDFYKDCLAKYEGWECYDFCHLKSTKSYQDNIGEFFRDVAEDGYKITFQDISEKYINEKNQKGELYLFEIRNKDWNLDKAREGKIKTTQKNLHTLYFESLFSAENIARNFPMKLNGQAEIFYRPKTEQGKLGIKKDKQGKEVTNHKRYNENKIFFHIPLTFNRTKNDPYRFNAQVNNFLAQNPSINIIGVDRGEKHLAYYSVITQNGEILDSGSLNSIGGVNYAEKLEEKAKNQEQAQKDWQAVEGIKDLKKGYISQVVRKLADLAIKHNAIIVFEDLNMRFKQIRGGIEKSVYQQLEKALIEKLSFLVNKGETNATKAGHLLKAYQLSAPFTTFQDVGKQTGIIFYTQAAYTSRIDPISGWRPHLYLKYSSADKAKEDILKFSKIEFINNRFEFTYDIKKFQQAKEYPKNTVWTVCSNIERFRWDKNLNNNKGGYTHYPNITDGKSENRNPKSTKPNNFKELFEKYVIDIARDIKEQIRLLEPKGNEKFFEHFIFFFNLICQIRNTDDSEQAKKTGKDDFIFSPIVPFFDSRKENEKNLPKNGDDNGAYNIARKGILILQKISEFYKEKGGCEKMNWGNLYVSNNDWDDFIKIKPHN